MKLRTLMLVASVAMLASCGEPYRATDTYGNVIVSDRTRADFIAQYPTASNITWNSYDQLVSPVDWELNGWQPLGSNDYVVLFDMSNDRYYAWYDANGAWIGTAYVMNDYKLLPAAVSTTISGQFPSYSISSVSREFQSDRMAYEVELKNSDTKVKLLIDPNGIIIKQKTKPLF